jgi:predicted membrane-bound spermidine synthase
MGRAARILYPLFLLSGFCGLIYESIWAKYLKLFLGHAAYAQAVVLVVFIGGMAIGAWLCGRFADKIRNPLVAYALAELAIGVAAVIFHRVFVAATGWAYASLLPSACNGEGVCISSWIFAASLILPQSILLGTTFPLMAAAIVRLAPERSGKTIATLYFLNSFGAVFGVLAASFVLVPWIGLPGASLSAGVANVLLAAVVYLYGRMREPAPALQPAAAANERAVGVGVLTLLVVALLTGLTSFVYEVVWIRMLSLVLGASTHAFELMLASFILGLALGGAWVRKRIDRLRDARSFLAIVQVVMGLLAVMTLALYNQMYEVMAWLLRSLARNDSGYVLFNAGSSIIAMGIMLPATFMAGMTLPLVTQLLIRSGHGERSIGYVYAWNTFGGIVGVLLAVHFGLPFAGLKWSLGIAAFVDIAIGLYLLIGFTSTARMPRSAIAVASVAAFAGVFAWSELDPQRMIAGVFRTGVARFGNGYTMRFIGDGKTSTIAVFDAPNGVRTIQTNGKPEASINLDGKTNATDEHTQTLAATLAFAFRPDVRDVAVIGFGSGMTTASVLTQPGVHRVDTIEIEPMMVAGAEYFRPAVDAAFADPRSKIIYDDARSYLARSGGRYDLIISEPSNPWVSGVASLFTAEFYEHMRRALRPGGVLVQWVQAYETNDRTIASITNAMSEVFTDFEVFRSNADMLFVARADGGVGALRADMFAHPSVRGMLEPLGIRGLVDLETRRIGGKRTLDQLLATTRAPANSDYFPIVESEAAHARFNASTAILPFDVLQLPLPLVDMFERRQWAASDWPAKPGPAAVGRASTSWLAAAAVHALTGQGPPEAVLPPEWLAGVAALHATFVECVASPNATGLLDVALGTAAVINRSLPPERAAQLWQAIASRPCAMKFPDRARWLALLHAVASRDSAATASRALTLLELPHTPSQTEFLVVCAYAGLRSAGRVDEAREFVRSWLPRLPPDLRRSPVMQAIAALSPPPIANGAAVAVPQ